MADMIKALNGGYSEQMAPMIGGKKEWESPIPSPFEFLRKMGFNVPSFSPTAADAAEMLPGAGINDGFQMGKDMSEARQAGRFGDAALLGGGSALMYGSELLPAALGGMVRKGTKAGLKMADVLQGANKSGTMPSSSGGRTPHPSGVPSGVPQPLPTYPEILPPVLQVDKKSGKEYLGKVNSPEALSVKKQIDAAQRDIDAGNYKPYFDTAKRTDVDPANYQFDTPTMQGNVPQRADTIEKYNNLVNSEEATQRIKAAFAEGQNIPDADRWYFMGQLEDEFIRELGPEIGRKAFEEKFAKSMASTTGGADPKSNLRMAMYGNYLKENNLPYPEASYDMPYPIGGRYAMGNIGMHEKMAGNPIVSKSNPKRNNFRGNFIGDNSSATIDEQMSGLFDPKLAMPPGNAYGVYEGRIAELAKEAGVAPRDYQDVAWAGAKRLKNPDRYGGSRPMIEEVNQAIERTARVTGLTPKQVLVEGIIKSKIPIYGVGGVVIAPEMIDAFMQEMSE
jgi:hypothetical protein